MALCSFSSKLVMDNYTVIDNTFLNEFLPGANGDDVKVYLYGLILCSNAYESDNNLDTISKVLSLSATRVKQAFLYWQEMGLVQIVSTNPFEVRYLPPRSNSGSLKIRDKSKFADFNKKLQDIITGRMISPNEYNEYYSLIETHHFEPEAVLLIVKYCTTVKSDNISYQYIMTVIRDFGNQGLKTFEAVENKFLEQEKSSEEIKQILKALGLKREADIEERNLYLKWTNTLGFTHGVILEVAKTVKKNGGGGYVKLDELLMKYYEQKLMSIEEISNFSKYQEELLEIAKLVSKNLGLVYYNYENVVSTYILDWVNRGYDKQSLEFVSNYCFRQNIHTLESMNVVVQKFFKLGLISMDAIEQYISSVLAEDEDIKQVLDALGLLRSVSSYDRDLYKTWTTNWDFTLPIILKVAGVSKGKTNSFSYMNKILASLNENNFRTEKQVDEYLKKSPVWGNSSSSKPNFDYKQHGYSPSQVTALFDALDDVEF